MTSKPLGHLAATSGPTASITSVVEWHADAILSGGHTVAETLAFVGSPGGPVRVGARARRPRDRALQADQPGPGRGAAAPLPPTTSEALRRTPGLALTSGPRVLAVPEAGTSRDRVAQAWKPWAALTTGSPQIDGERREAFSGVVLHGGCWEAGWRGQASAAGAPGSLTAPCRAVPSVAPAGREDGAVDRAGDLVHRVRLDHGQSVPPDRDHGAGHPIPDAPSCCHGCNCDRESSHDHDDTAEEPH